VRKMFRRLGRDIRFGRSWNARGGGREGLSRGMGKGNTCCI